MSKKQQKSSMKFLSLEKADEHLAVWAQDVIIENCQMPWHDHIKHKLTKLTNCGQANLQRWLMKVNVSAQVYYLKKYKLDINIKSHLLYQAN